MARTPITIDARPLADTRSAERSSGLERLLAEERRLERGLQEIDAWRTDLLARAEAAVAAEEERLDAGWPAERAALEEQIADEARRGIAQVGEKARRTVDHLDAATEEQVATLAEELVRDLVEGP